MAVEAFELLVSLNRYTIVHEDISSNTNNHVKPFELAIPVEDLSFQVNEIPKLFNNSIRLINQRVAFETALHPL